jgi:arsenite-transporting ATPase
MKIVFFTGKGGVGKSTMAAAAAWQLSLKHRVLVVSLDPAHNLGDIFGVKLGQKHLRFKNSLYLHEIDLARLSRSYLQREIEVLSDTYKYIQTLNLDNYFSILKYSPGLEEYTLLSSVDEIIREGARFDYIVFDTPPTGLTLRFLALPRVTLTWLERLIEVRRMILKKRHTIQKIRGMPAEAKKSREILLRYDENEDRVLNRLISLEEKYRTLNETLQGQLCNIALVFTSDLLSFKESERLIRGLNELNLPLRLLIHNKISEDEGERAREIEEKMTTLVNGVPVEQVAYADTLHEGGDASLYHIRENIISTL